MVLPLRKLAQIVRDDEQRTTPRPDSSTWRSVWKARSSATWFELFPFGSYVWYVYYLVAYAVCLRRIYESDTGRVDPRWKTGKNERERLNASHIRTAEA
jgi:hypothetical protein